MAGEIKQFKDANNNTHKVDITGVEGLQSALDGKVSKNEIKGITFHNIDTSTTINPADIADGFIHQLNNALGRTLSSILGGSGYIHYHQNAGSLTDTAICVRVYAGTAPHYIVEIACAYTM